MKRSWLALTVLALPLLLVSMDVSILYFAAPQIAEDLHASPTQQLWIFDVYGFVLAGLLITMGALADRIGSRRLLLIGAFGFSATSLAAAFSQSAGQLITARALLGVAGATLMPSTLAMVRTLFDDERDRAKAVAIWTGVMTAGVGLGPVLGGGLLERFDWGSVFLVNLPAMALLLLTGPFLLPRTPGRRTARFDVLGALLSLGAVLPSVYGVKEWAAQGYDVRWPAAIGVGLALGLVFVHRMLHHPAPLIPVGLLRNRGYLGAVGANALATFALVGNAVFMTAYLQLVLGQRPIVAALWSLAPTAGVALATPLASVAGARFGRPVVIGAGLVVAAGGFAVLSQVGTDSLAWILVGAGVLAAGLVAAMTMAGEAVLASVSAEQAGAGTAVSESATELGGALGIALLGSVGAVVYRHQAADLPGAAHGSLAGAVATASHVPGAETILAVARAAYVDGLHVAAVVGAVVLLLGAVLALVAMRRRQPQAEVTTYSAMSTTGS